MFGADQEIEFSYAIPSLPAWQRRFVRLVERVYGQRVLYKTYRRFLDLNAGPESFWEDARFCLDTEVRTTGRDLPSIPREGPLLVVANHPFGLVDGVAVSWLVSQVRKDFKLIAWDVFSHPPGIDPYLISLDLEDDCRKARRQNVAARRESTQWLRDGHCIVLFPAGTAALSASMFSPPEEYPWGRFGAKLIHDADATVLPMFVHGQNSRLFHAAGHLGYFFRLALFFRETTRKLGKPVYVTSGRPMAPDELRTVGNEDEQMNYLRDLTLSLGTDLDDAPTGQPIGPLDRVTNLSVVPLES